MSEYIFSDGHLISVNELQHHGVKGMKWGVRKAERKKASPGRDAKELANLKAKEYDAKKAVSLKDGPYLMKKSYESRVAKASEKYNTKLNEMLKKYKDTTLSDIKVYEHTVEDGRAYCQVLMGLVEDSPYAGRARYQVTAGTWSKLRYRKLSE